MKANKRPEWLKIRVRSGENVGYVEELLEKYALHTVCREANCPNRTECYNKKTATFLILGSVCTRNCRFCNVTKGQVEPVDPQEPEHIARAVSELGLRYVVITSVTRDDLTDGGAGHFAAVVERIKYFDPHIKVEVLIPDFQGNQQDLETVMASGPDVINHNIETVQSLYPEVRPQADYYRSLELLQRAKELQSVTKKPRWMDQEDKASVSSSPASGLLTKSGLMLGLGEKESEVIQTLHDLREAKCDLLTIGQYLAPSKDHHPVIEYIHPDTFSRYRDIALELGFKGVASAPFVRSSYNAAEMANSAGNHE
jgi:lipoic acid synthetase